MNRFNKPVDRLGTSSIKWDLQKERIGKEGLLPFWVADSDYQTADPIINALIKRIKHGIFGYTIIDNEYREIVKQWFTRRYHYNIENEWIVTTPGVVTALYYAVEFFTSPKASIIIQTPVYNPFYDVITSNKRIVAQNKLISVKNTYKIDFNNLEKLLIDGAEMLIMCNPHNPVGRVWKYEEVAKVVDLCKRYNCLIVSDEIHCDLIYKNVEFTSFGQFFDDYERIIVCTAPSKTFNLAGLITSNIIIKDEALRKTFKEGFASRSLREPNLLGIEACKAAYTECDQWLEEQIVHLSKNAKLVYKYFKENIPLAKIAKLEGTYLMWIDMRFLGLCSQELVNGLVDYGILVNSGAVYGQDYDGFIRLNIACPKKQLEEGLAIIGKFVSDQNK
ncbi:MAG: PatB family C-S lyase [Bacilli bacterium]|nr:PatB family C-S lyase [Bacilli bacterium]